MCDCTKSITGLAETGEEASVTTQFTPEFILDQIGSTYSDQIGLYTSNGSIAHINFNLSVNTYNTPGALYLTFQLPETSGSAVDQYVNFTVYQGVSPGFFTTITVPGVIIPGSDIVTLALNMALQPLDQWQGNFYYIV